jgi:serine phosphatase RsbU (regulator of sigma subunit)
MAELLIYTPDGKKRYVPLDAEKITLGRSTTADLCFAEDTGLSRLHLAFERTPHGFLVRDLNSKNGTTVNGARVTGAQPLKSNDRVSCGHLLIVFDPPRRLAPAVEFVDDDTGETSGSTIVTSLGGVINEARKNAGPGSHVSALIQAGNELAGQRPLPDLFRVILDLSIGAVSARRGVLLTLENGALVERASKGENFKISSAVRSRVLESKLSVLVRDTTLDDAFRGRQSIIAANVRTLMAVPLQTQDRVMGLIYVDSPTMRGEFTKDDLNLLTVMANIATNRIEHARLTEAEQARQLMERDLEQAESIQRGALPSTPPCIPGLDIAGYNAASRTVGGDYYDYFPDANGRTGIMVADVSGKGMPAALMVMALQARVQPLFETLPVAPGALQNAMDRLNRLTAANCPTGKFITVFAFLADGKTGRLDWSCAGHNPPIIVRANGSYETLDGGGPVMGVFQNIRYPQDVAQLNSGDLIAVYSDGITEAVSPSDQDFDIPVLAKALVQYRHLCAQEIVEAVVTSLREWTENAPLADDITLVIARKL